jgi:hypothetical protein
MRYVIVRQGVIENAVEWDGETPWSPPEGATIHQSATGDIAWQWNDGAPFDPNPPPLPQPPPEPTPQAKLAALGLSVDDLRELLGLP